MGYDPLQIGLAFLPVAVVMGTLSVRYTDRLVMRFGARTLLFPGLGLIAAGLALFALVPRARRRVPGARVPGHGADRRRRGPVLPGADGRWAMSSATPAGRRAGLGLVNTTAQIGGALGLAVLATVSASRTNALIAQHRPTAVALTEGLPPGLLDRVRPGRRSRRGRRRAAAARRGPPRRPEPEQARELVPAIQAD